MQTVFLRSLKGDGNLFDLDYCGAYTGTYTCQDLKWVYFTLLLNNADLKLKQ